jgi:hypothetical protein
MVIPLDMGPTFCGKIVAGRAELSLSCLRARSKCRASSKASHACRFDSGAKGFRLMIEGFKNPLSVACYLAVFFLNTLPAVIYADGKSALLADARRLLASGKETEASLKYGQITESDELFVERLEDMVRWHLLGGRSEEAWRIVEMSRRMKFPMANLNYYGALALLKSGACPLYFLQEPVRWAMLINAHIYRFGRSFSRGSYSSDPYQAASRGTRQTHLSSEQTPFLKDLKATRIIRGAGCRGYKEVLSDKKESLKGEFALLSQWYRKTQKLAGSNKRAGPFLAEVEPGTNMVLSRLLEMAWRAKDSELMAELLLGFKSMPVADWVALPEPERRFYFQKMVEGGLLAAGPYSAMEDGSQTPPPFALAFSVIVNSKDKIAGKWAGLIGYDRLSAEERLSMVTHLLSIEGIEHRQYLLLQLATLHYQKGNVRKSLAAIKRLLVDGGDNLYGDQLVFDGATQLAMEILSEYRYDEKILGIIQTSLPRSLWGRSIRQMLIRHGLTGTKRAFRIMSKMMPRKRLMRLTRLKENHYQFLEALADRRLSRFSKATDSLGGKGRLPSQHFNFLREVAEQVLALTPFERQGVQPYLSKVAASLLSYLKQGRARVEFIDLIYVFDQKQQEQWTQGSTSVTSGAVAVGSINIGQKAVVPYPFKWSAPDSLGARDLLVMPISFAGRQWHIK